MNGALEILMAEAARLKGWLHKLVTLNTEHGTAQINYNEESIAAANEFLMEEGILQQPTTAPGNDYVGANEEVSFDLVKGE